MLILVGTVFDCHRNERNWERTGETQKFTRESFILGTVILFSLQFTKHYGRENNESQSHVTGEPGM